MRYSLYKTTFKMDHFASLCLCLLVCTGVVMSEESGQLDTENAEVTVKDLLTTDELIDLICSCREDKVSTEDYPRDCYDIQQSGETRSGLYTIYPSVAAEAGKPIDVFCDITTEGGGWTVYQRRDIGNVDFNRGWEDYKNGFGYVAADFWLGNENIFVLTNQKKNEMRIEMQEWDGTNHYIAYDLFRLGDETTGYKLFLRPSSNSTGSCQDVFQLGMEDGRIEDSHISASSEWADSHRAQNARLNRPAGDGRTGAWSAGANNANQWIQAQFESSRLVAGVILQGRPDYGNEWVTQYKVQYSEDGSTWQFVNDANGDEMTFDGVSDRTTPVTQMFSTPVKAKSVRINPTAWQGHIALRFELLGCEGDSLTTNHNFNAFSTQDVDNDADGDSNCALYNGPWWYGTCDDSGLNGEYHLEALTETGGIAWTNYKGSTHYLKTTEMKIRPVGTNTNE